MTIKPAGSRSTVMPQSALLNRRSRRERHDRPPGGRRAVSPEPTAENPIVRAIQNEVLAVLPTEIQGQPFTTERSSHDNGLLAGRRFGTVFAPAIAAASDLGAALVQPKVIGDLVPVGLGGRCLVVHDHTPRPAELSGRRGRCRRRWRRRWP